MMPPLIAETNTAQFETNTATVTFKGYATNVFSSIDPPAVYFKTNGGTYALIANDIIWETNFDTTTVPNSINEYTFLAVSSNNLSNTYVLSNVVDNSPPYGEVTNYVNGAIIVGTAVNIRGTNYENVSDITSTALLTNDAFFGSVSTSPGWTFTLDTTLFY